MVSSPARPALHCLHGLAATYLSIHACIHGFMHVFTHLLTLSLAHSLTPSLTHSLTPPTHPPTHPVILPVIYRLSIHPFVKSMIQYFLHSSPPSIPFPSRLFVHSVLYLFIHPMVHTPIHSYYICSSRLRLPSNLCLCCFPSRFGLRIHYTVPAWIYLPRNPAQ